MCFRCHFGSRSLRRRGREVRHNLRLALVVLGVGAAFLTFGVVGALAGFPHFTKVTTSISTSSTSASTTATASADVTQAFLNVSFREAGLGSNEGTLVRVTADATAVYACINKGGRNPKAANKQTVGSPVSAEGTFTSDKNGSISGTLTAAAPGPGDFTCSSGQTLVLASVTFSSIVITDVTNGIFTTADDITAVFFQL
jgi:hypothetical protein